MTITCKNRAVHGGKVEVGWTDALFAERFSHRNTPRTYGELTRKQPE